MVATLILHSRADLDWAVALAAELTEHAPVRLQLGASPPKATIGPSVVRVALWSDEAAGEAAGASLASLLNADPAHSVLVRRQGCAPPPGVDPSRLASDFVVSSARDAAVTLREKIPIVGAAVAQIVTAARVKAETARERVVRRADQALLLLSVLLLAAAAIWFNWGGAGTWAQSWLTRLTGG
jgi:hypothetical protein